MSTVYGGGGSGGGSGKMEIHFYRVFLSCFRKIMLQREPTVEEEEEEEESENEM